MTPDGIPGPWGKAELLPSNRESYSLSTLKPSNEELSFSTTALRKRIITKTNLSEIQWAGMYIDVLPLRPDLPPFTRSVLCLKLGLLEHKPLGRQLKQMAVLDGKEAALIDYDFFTEQPVSAWLRFWGERSDIWSLILGLQQNGLLQYISEIAHEDDERLVISLTTNKFAAMCKVISTVKSVKTMLLSLSDRVYGE